MLEQSRKKYSGRIRRIVPGFIAGFALVALSAAIFAFDSSQKRDADDYSPVVVLDFWAAWCAPCLEINQRLDELESEMRGRFEVVRINIDEEPGIAHRFGVESLPTVVVIRDRIILGRFRGGRSKAEIRAFLEEFLKQDPYAFLGPTASI